MIQFTIEGQPVGKGRPRVARNHAYTPKKTAEYEKKVKDAYLAIGGKNHGKEPIFMHIAAYYQVPKQIDGVRLKKADVERCLIGELIPGKPDVDNVTKAIMDALNGVAYDDDSQVVSVWCEKRFARTPQVIVSLEGAND